MSEPIVATYDDAESVPADFKDTAVEADGKYTVTVYAKDSYDSVVSDKEAATTQLGSVVQERDAAKSELTSLVGDHGVDTVKSWVKNINTNELVKEVVENGTKKAIDGAVEKRVSNKDKAIGEATAEAASWKNLFIGTKVSDEVKTAASTAGVAKTAMDDVVTRAKGDWAFEYNAKTGEGSLVNKTSPDTTMEAYMSGLKTNAPHLFAQVGAQGLRRPGINPGAAGANQQRGRSDNGVSKIASGLGKS